MRILRRHWRGRYALLPTLIVTALLGRVALGYVQTFVPIENIKIWLWCSVAIFVWQVVGTSRAAGRCLKDSGNVMAVFASYFVCLVLAVLTFVQVADGLASKHQPLDSVVVVKALPVVSDATVVVIDGSLNWQLFAQFKQTLAENQNLTEVRFNSTGGYVFVARAMALKILERKLDTHVEARCYSACTIAFLAGQRRTIDENARLGFHRYKLESAPQPALIDVDVELEKDRQFFAERGLSNEFIEQVFHAEHSQLWMPDIPTMIVGGVLVD